MLCEIPLIHLAVCEHLEWKTKLARSLAWMAFRVRSNLKYIFISLAEKDSQDISKVYFNTHWCYEYFFSRKKMPSALFLTIYMGRGFYFKTTQTSLSNWLSLIYLQVLRKHNGEFPIMTKIHNPLQNVSRKIFKHRKYRDRIFKILFRNLPAFFLHDFHRTTIQM